MDDELDRRLARLYARIPPVDCKGKCWDSCTIVHNHNEYERKRVVAAGGDLHGKLTVQQTRELRQALGGGMPACPSLNVALGVCNVYAVRPFGCRLWPAGVVDHCSEGCRPEWPISPSEQLDMLRELDAIEQLAREKGEV